MSRHCIPFTVSSLAAHAPEGVPVEWQGKEFSSGPLFIELDDRTGGQQSRGVLDYSAGRAQAEFHVRLRFPEFAEILEDLGADPKLAEPVYGIIRSEGDILDDHSFALSGSSELL